MTDLIIQYIIYAAVIVLGLIVLAFLKKSNKLPSHKELKRMMEELCVKLQEICKQENAGSEGLYLHIKEITKATYRTDKLIYIVTMMAEKERDTKLSAAAVNLENVRTQLLPYRFKTKTNEDLDGIRAAIAELEKALASVNKIIERDKELRTRRA